MNLGSPSYSEQEQTRFQVCLTKYAQALSIYKEESDLHYDALERV